jgi:F-type H+-transporting ATPase subunit delta
MAIAGSSARRYAEALLEIATETGSVRAFRSSLERLRDAIGHDALRALRDRRVPIERRLAALDAAAKDEPKPVRAILTILLERDRIALLPEVARALGELIDRREGTVIAKVTTPVELDERQQGDLIRRLERTSGKRVRATFHVDPALLGGARIQLGDRLIDTTVRAQLDAMRAQLST